MAEYEHKAILSDGTVLSQQDYSKLLTEGSVEVGGRRFEMSVDRRRRERSLMNDILYGFVEKKPK